MNHWFIPSWQPHPNVRLGVTTRLANLSPPPWQGFNLGLNTGDEAQRVLIAREQVWQELGTEHPPYWLTQVHGKHLVEAGSNECEADGVWTSSVERPCVVLTADCLPVLFARVDGSKVAAVHAGWRGLAQGILPLAAKLLAPNQEPLAAWIGPAISASAYQVGSEVYEAFASNPNARSYFLEDGPNHWRCDLAGLAKWQLSLLGVSVTLSELCTVNDAEQRFYSYRKEGQTGRFASLIWLEPERK